MEESVRLRCPGPYKGAAAGALEHKKFGGGVPMVSLFLTLHARPSVTLEAGAAESFRVQAGGCCMQDTGSGPSEPRCVASLFPRLHAAMRR